MKSSSYQTRSPFTGERQRLVRDAVVNNVAAFVSAIVGFLLVPVMLRALRQEEYGLWIIAISMSGILAAIDFGLYWSVTRVVASGFVDNRDDQVDFIRFAANIYLLIGIAGWIALGIAGLLSFDMLRLPSVRPETAAGVFLLVGAVFCADRLNMFGFAVLHGLRRFDLINTIGSFAAIAWAAGAVAVLMGGGGILAVAFCQLAATVAKSIVTLWLAARLSPSLRFMPFFLRLSAFRHHLSFALSSQVANLLNGVSWNAAPMLLGLISGTTSAVPFFIGQKFPMAVSSISWRSAEVLFPAASENRHDIIKSGEILRVGSRCILVLVLPLTVVLFVAAPGILQAWLGYPPQGAAAVLRIMAAAVLADAVMVASLHLLWGQGKVRPILIVNAVQGPGVVVLTCALVCLLGVSGAAWGMLIPMGAGAVALFTAASRECKMDAWKLAARTWHGLVLPTLACAVSASALIYFFHDSRLSAIAAVAVGVLSYVSVFFGFSGSVEEKRVARAALSRLPQEGILLYRLLRSTMAKVPFFRSSWHFAVALVEFASDHMRHSSYFERIFATPDPWGSETHEGRAHFLKVVSLLDGARQGKFRRALEVGCAEGAFTEILALYCEALVASDFAPTALERARQRLTHAHVSFENLNILTDPVPGAFDLITAMDVLECILHPWVLRRVRDKLVGALEPGGYCLLVCQRQNKEFEKWWWGKILLRGGVVIREFIGSHPSLRLVYSDTTEQRVYALFRKIPA